MHKRYIISIHSNQKAFFQFYNAKYLYNREKQRLTGENIQNIPPQQDDSLIQNQTPTANLQALVPKFAARGQ